MEHGLRTAELRNGRQNAASIASQQDDILGMAVGQARDLRIADVLDGVGTAG